MTREIDFSGPKSRRIIDISVGREETASGPGVEKTFDGRIRDRITLDGPASEDVDFFARARGEMPATGQTLASGASKSVPGKKVKLTRAAALMSDVLIAPATSNTLSPAGRRKLNAQSRLLLEPLTKRVHRLEPALGRDINVQVQITAAQASNAVRIALGHLGISDPADRFEDKDLITYGGEMIIVVRPYRFPDTTANRNRGIVGKRQRQFLRFYSNEGVRIEVAGGDPEIPGTEDFNGATFRPSFFLQRNADLDHHGATPFEIRTYGTGVDASGNAVLGHSRYLGELLIENGEPVGDGSRSIPTTTRATFDAPVADDAEIVIRVPWTLRLNVTFNGTWTEPHPETGQRSFIATGGYAYTRSVTIGPCSRTV